MRRACIAFICLALFSWRLASASTEIPAKYLQQEARMRAAMTPNAEKYVASFTARLTTKMTVADVKTMTRGANTETVFLVMLEYLKMLQKEAREDRRLAEAAEKAKLASKNAKLEQESAKIDTMKREAEQKFDNAMQAANLEMIYGVVSAGGVAAVGATAFPTATPTRTSAKPIGVRVR